MIGAYVADVAGGVGQLHSEVHKHVPQGRLEGAVLLVFTNCGKDQEGGVWREKEEKERERGRKK